MMQTTINFVVLTVKWKDGLCKTGNSENSNICKHRSREKEKTRRDFIEGRIEWGLLYVYHGFLSSSMVSVSPLLHDGTHDTTHTAVNDIWRDEKDWG